LITPAHLGQIGDEAADSPPAHEQDYADYESENACEPLLLVSGCGLAIGCRHDVLLHWRLSGPEQHDTGHAIPVRVPRAASRSPSSGVQSAYRSPCGPHAVKEKRHPVSKCWTGQGIAVVDAWALAFWSASAPAADASAGAWAFRGARE